MVRNPYEIIPRAGYTFARGFPQIATGLIDLFALPLTMTGIAKPENIFLSTDYLTKRGYLPTPEMGLGGLVGETGELLSSAISPGAVTKSAILAGGGLLADAARLSGADLTPVGAISLPKGLLDEPGITAYHGSPYDFDRFQLDKIGEGEGAQAFGYGLYFTDSEDIAKFYKDKLSDEMTSDVRYSFKGEEYERGTPEWKMLSTIYNRGTANAKKLVKELKSDLAKGEPYITADQVNRYEAILNQAPKKSQIKQNFGRTYEVDIAPKVSELIDYDKPLGEQNQFIKDALKKVADEMNINDARNLGFDDFEFGGSEQKAINAAKKVMLDKDQSVVAFLNNWAVFRGEQGAGEELLKKHGVRGIKYKANQGVGARNVPEQGANNYVIFDDKDVSIKRKYELGGAGAAGLLGYGILTDRIPDEDDGLI